MTESLVIVAAALVACAAVVAAGVVLWRTRGPAQPDADAIAEIARRQADSAARLETMIRMLGDRQSQLQHAVGERLDAVSHRLGESLQKTTQHTSENLQKLGERLAVIDTAQKNITELATQVSSLQSVLTNKQSRGAFGQGQMEAIIQDRLPKGSYEFQYSLSNHSRPDCCVFLADKRPLVIDAKFPLEAVTAYRDAKADDERKLASQRLRIDVGKHIADIAAKYLIPGETQDLAFMFIPSESLYADLHDGFDDIEAVMQIGIKRLRGDEHECQILCLARDQVFRRDVRDVLADVDAQSLRRQFALIVGLGVAIGGDGFEWKFCVNHQGTLVGQEHAAVRPAMVRQ